MRRKTYTPREVVSLTGVSRTQLHYWARVGVIPAAPGRGVAREFSFLDLVQCRLAHLLTEALSATALLFVMTELAALRFDGKTVWEQLRDSRKEQTARLALRVRFNLDQSPSSMEVFVGRAGEALKRLGGDPNFPGIDDAPFLWLNLTALLLKLEYEAGDSL